MENQNLKNIRTYTIQGIFCLELVKTDNEYCVVFSIVSQDGYKHEVFSAKFKILRDAVDFFRSKESDLISLSEDWD